MAKTNVEHYACAVIAEGKHMLLLRELGKDDFPLTGYHFPGGKCRGEDSVKDDLGKALARKYGAKVKVVASITPIAHVRGGKKEVLHGFFCEALTPLRYPSDHFQYVYSDFSGLSSLYLDPLDKVLAEKVALYYPIYAYKKRLAALSPKEKDEAKFYLDSLFYFRTAIPAKEISDFSMLIRCDSTISDIRKAYFWLLKLYGLDLNEYLDLLSYRRSHPTK